MHKARGLYGTEHPMYAHESTSTQARTRSLGTFGPASRIMPVLIVIAIAAPTAHALKEGFSHCKRDNSTVMARSVDASLVYDEAVMGYRAGQLDGDDASVGLGGLHLQSA